MREEFVQLVRTYLGAPYMHQGRSKAGIDCIGLYTEPSRILGISFRDSTSYSAFGRGGNLVDEFKKAGMVETPVGSIADILLFWVSKRRVPRHVGILTSQTTFITCSWKTITPYVSFIRIQVLATW